MLIRLFSLFFLVVAFASQGFAQSADPKPLFEQLGTANFNQAADVIAQIGATGDPRVVPALEALSEGDLYIRKSDKLVFIAKPAGSQLSLVDPLTGEEAGEVAKSAVTKIRVNNNLRRSIRAALGGLTLMSPDRGARLQAATSILGAPSAENLDLLETALAQETDGEVRERMEEARAVSLLSSDRAVDEK